MNIAKIDYQSCPKYNVVVNGVVVIIALMVVVITGVIVVVITGLMVVEVTASAQVTLVAQLHLFIELSNIRFGGQETTFSILFAHM
jgi:hypothetical protein